MELRPVLVEHLAFQVLLETPPPQVPHSTGLYGGMAGSVRAQDPAAVVVLWYLSAATDAKYLAPIGVPAYGFAPRRTLPDMRLMKMFHAHHERALVNEPGWGVQVLYDVVRRYCDGGNYSVLL